MKAILSHRRCYIRKTKGWAKNPNYKIQSITIHIHISFNPFKWIYLNPNPYFWILNPIHLIGYGLDIDWIHLWIIQIAFWDGF